MREVRLRAFAKVNYALDILGLRADGYHEVSTVMQSISLADEVELRTTGTQHYLPGLEGAAETDR
jgi:4-diphosphocytidyl-2-C-methyl-D-erythritol kinase